MKNPFRSERGTLTSGRACAVYALAFVLMLFLDATRFSSFLDRAGIDFPPAAVVGQTVKGVAEATGLAAFSEAETRLVTAFNTDKTLGTVEGPSVAAAPSTAPQRPVADALAALAKGKTGNYLAFFPSYAYLQQVYEAFAARWPDISTLVQQRSLDDAGRAEFLAQFQKSDGRSLLGFAVLGGVFGEGVDLTGESLIGAAIVSPGLPQVGPRQEQLRDYFEQTRGSGFDYAYRFPGMNKVLQAAGRVIRTPEDRGVVLLIDDRFLAPDTRRLMPPHWEQLRVVESAETLAGELERFWGR